MPASSQVSGQVTIHDRSELKVVTDGGNVIQCCSTATWYVPRDEIEENSPSRKDGIDTAKENLLRKSYCAFLRDIGIKLKMPHVAIATSTVFCHRFYLHQSHQTNDRYTIATACIFLAGKVEESRRALEEVVLLSYSLQNKNNPAAAQEIKEKEVYERQKELVLVAEQVVLVTLDFNLTVLHPYNFLLAATFKFKSAPEALARVACIIVNDGLYTSLCLQFKPQHIAAGALFLSAKLLKFKFPSKTWWKEFNVTLWQLEGVSSQILELYEQERVPFVSGQSSSSSSSVDEKAQVLCEAMANSVLQPHHEDSSAALLTSSLTTLTKECQLNTSISTGFPSVSLPTEPKLGLKQTIERDSWLTSSNSKVLAKRKRPDGDSYLQGTSNLQIPGKVKSNVASRREK